MGMEVDGFVLVHGAFHGAWCWDEVRAKLGLPAVAVDLPGRGRRPLTDDPVTIDQCVDAVIGDADAAGLSRFVLVGHSLGGQTITEVANRHADRTAHLVYLAAMAFPPGRSVADHYFPDDSLPVDGPAGVVPLMDEESAHQMFAGDLSPEAFAPVYAQCVPEPGGLFRAAVSGYQSGVPATYVRCTRDGTVGAAITADMVATLRPSVLHDIDADHDIMLSRPGVVADLLNGAADLASDQETPAR
jgi:pimeloyl-ACP methyl ester carboxylesterase